jgi:transcriptional regulator GlxA family with amidase domain
MQEAEDLLTGTDLSVAQIAARLGYTSDVAFRKAFRKVTGASPGKVRRAGRSGATMESS